MTYEDIDFLANMERQFSVKKDDKYGKLVHFQNNRFTPYQRWFQYREGYSYKLVDKFIKKFNPNSLIFDPFVGSGSTLLAARLNNLSSIGMDVNPLSTFISLVENTKYTKEDMDCLNRVIKKIKVQKRDSKYRETNFNLASRYFNSEILQSLLQFRDFYKSINNVHIKNLVKLAWLSIIESSSYMKKEGNGLKRKNRKRLKNRYVEIPIKEWDKEHFPEDKFEFIKGSLIQKLNIMRKDIIDYPISAASSKVINKSSIGDLSMIQDEIGLTIFSPPYVNFFDYFEIHKMELWLGEFIQNREDFRALKKKGMRSNGNAIDSTKIHFKNKNVEHFSKLISTKKLWNKRIPDVINSYFDDMYILLKNIFLKTKQNGKVVIVIGNSAYGGILVPADLLVADIAQTIGFKVNDICITRFLTTSSQQKKKLMGAMNYMRESIVVLTKE
ncbi:DNA methyltransferase [Lactobacillus amylovorus]|uniref:DNA methyltransferase n=1 Tax=Lactobacillus amylovorus TaxID=1604 RepID=UPI00232FF65A|nr:DNA methyltransferase [Lactobacillus amylovorus]MDB6242122.1 site-specific DNA-methyltransferase [Lactobacillus amylovorus]MDB6251584.1 site-specific DNA-methyltransferase [Lactobacillus amylovorus]